MSVKLMVKNLDDPDKCTVTGEGFGLQVATGQSLAPFGFPRATGYHPALWAAINDVYGRPPNDAYATEPTGGQHGGGAFTAWRVPQCQVKQTFKSAKLVSLDAKPEILSAVLHDNSGNDKEASFHAGLTREISDSAERTHETHWTAGYSLTVGVEVGNEASAVKASVEQTFSFEGGESKSETKSMTHTLSAEMSSDVVVEPRSKKRSVLYAAFGKAVIDVTYDLELIGNMYIYYKKSLYNHGHHVFCKIDQLIDKRPKSFKKHAEATERIEIGVYGDSYVRVENA